MSEEYEVQYSTRLKGPSVRRIAIVAVCGLVLLVSAAVTMAASPSSSPGSPSASAPTGQGNPGPGNPWANGNGRHGFGGMGMAPGMGMGPWANGKGFPGMGPGGIGRGVGFGQIRITAISGDQVSLATTDGWTRTITVASSTTITKSGKTIAVGDLKVGDTIRFRETRNTDGTFTIAAIDVVLPQVGGTVTGLTGDGFTVKAFDGSSWTVTVTGATSYNLGRQSGSKSDVKVGDEVRVEGTSTGTGAMTATNVQIAPAMVAGTVTGKTSTTITVKAFDGSSVTINVGTGTTYQVAGVTNPGLANVTVGSMIAAEGTRNSDGSLNATIVRSGNGRGMGKGWMRGGSDAPQAPAGPGTFGSSSQG